MWNQSFCVGTMKPKLLQYNKICSILVWPLNLKKRILHEIIYNWEEWIEYINGYIAYKMGISKRKCCEKKKLKNDDDSVNREVMHIELKW